MTDIAATDAEQRINELLKRQADLHVQISTIRLESAKIKTELYELAVASGRSDLASSLANAVAIPW